MYREQKILIGKSGEEDVNLFPKMANRHGMIAGATGTGKTVTLKMLAESFSDCGVPVFLADVKGDLAGTCQKGVYQEKLESFFERRKMDGHTYPFHACPVQFWDVYGEKGIPLRTTVSEVGPLLLARMLNLNETQKEVLTVVFKIADDEGLLLLDSKDLRAMLQFVGEHAKEYSAAYGNMSKQSLGAIIRAVIALEAEGGDTFFGEPALNLTDWLARDCEGHGMIQILDCQRLVQNPCMYAAFLLWLMSELFEILPEAGDLEKPRMVFFFDEAHLLFDTASKELLARIEQVVKLIRSKGVGIYFITQSPKDIPDGVLAQLGNKIQHALHAYTPAEQKGAKAAAQSFRINPEFDTYKALLELEIGEALVSVLDEQGVPTVVKRTQILSPVSQMGPIEDSVRETEIQNSLLYLKYRDMTDRESAYEILEQAVIAQEEESRRQKEEELRKKEEAAAERQRQKEEAAAERQKQKEEAAAERQKQKEEEAAERQRQKEEAAAERQRQKEEAAAEHRRQKEEAAAERQRQKELEAKEKEALKQQQAREKQWKSTFGKAAGSAAGTIGREMGNQIGKQFGGSFGKRIGGNVGSTLGRGILDTLLKR